MEDYYCDICDKTIKIKSVNEHLKSLSHSELDKCIRINHTIENPNFVIIDEIFYEYITNDHEKLDLYLVKNDFDLIFNRKFHPRNKSELQNNTTIFQLKSFITLD